MKKRIIMILSILTVLAIFVFVWIFLAQSTFLTIEKSNIDNSYNNLKANTTNQIIQIDNHLFIDYSSKIGWGDGTYEISENGKSSKLSSESISLDNVLDGKILNMDSTPISFYDTTVKSFVKFDGMTVPDSVKDFERLICNGNVYFLSEKQLYMLSDNKLKLLAEAKDLKLDSDSLTFDNIYITDKYIYYKNNVNQKDSVCRYHINTHKIDTLEINRDINTLIVDNGVAYILSNLDKIYKVDFNSNTVSVLYETDGIGTLIFNVCNNKVCFSVQSYEDVKGLYVVDEQQNIKKISDAECLELYFLDDKYIYYRNMDLHFYRIPIDGGSAETVFDKNLFAFRY